MKSSLAPKLMLVNPGRGKPWASLHAPMQLGFLASYARERGFFVTLADELSGQDVAQRIALERPDIVGFTATSALVPDAYRLAEAARSAGCRTIMGGAHASTIPEDALEHVDQVVCGEGEQALIEILEGRRDPLVRTGHLPDLDALSPPAWDLMDMEFYLRRHRKFANTHVSLFPSKARLASVMTSRGCPFSCIYCCNNWRDTPVRYHSVDWIREDLLRLRRDYSMDALYFADDDLFTPAKRLFGLCEMLQRDFPHLRWSCQARAKAASSEALRAAKEAGCVQVQFGLESGSPRILKMLKKGTTEVEDNLRAVELCREAGLVAFGSLMIGSPGETEEDLQMTYEFLRKARIDRAGILITFPYPGTELWRGCQDRGLIPSRPDWNVYTSGPIAFLCSEHLTPERLLWWQRRMERLVRPLGPGEIFSMATRQAGRVLRALASPAATIRKIRSRLSIRRSSETHENRKM